MKQAAYILFAAGMTYATCLCTGITLLRALRLELARSEERFFGFLTGAGVLSLLVFALAAVHLAYKGVFLTLGLLAFGLCYASARRGGAKPVLPLVPSRWRVLFWCGYIAYLMVYLPTAMAPEVSPDGVSYHVGLVARYYHTHSLQWLTTNMYASLSEGIEMLFLFAYGLATGLGRPSAAAMTHFLFLLTLPFGMLSYGRRFGMPGVGVAGALLFFMTPVVGKSGSSAYNDVAVAAILFGLFYVLQVWAAERKEGLLVVAGLLAGFAYAAKYTAFPAVPFALAYVAFQLRREKAAAFRAVLITTGCALILIAPWVVKNIIVVRNPVAPLFNSYFPNPYFHVAMEKEYVTFMRHFNDVAYRDIPLEVCIRGNKLIGVVGPVFLLSPLALLALRRKQGRLLLLATVVFGATFFGNIETRFLIPALPFLSLALALALSWRFWPLALVLAHAALSWPLVVDRYVDSHAWRFGEFPWKTAFLRKGEDLYLMKHLGDSFDMARLIKDKVPPGETILSLGTALPRAYIPQQEVIFAYESAWGRNMALAVQVSQFESSGPILRAAYKFPARKIERLRVVQSGRADWMSWGVDELRFYRNRVEVPRDSRWRLRANPNPWDVQLAFDNNPSTRWSSWEDYRPGMNLDVDFGRAVEIDEVVVTGPPDEDQPPLRVEEWSNGAWHAVPAAFSREKIPMPERLRTSAAEYLKANGVRWLATSRDEWSFQDFIVNRKLWGLTPVAHTENLALFKLE